MITTESLLSKRRATNIIVFFVFSLITKILEGKGMKLNCTILFSTVATLT